MILLQTSPDPADFFPNVSLCALALYIWPSEATVSTSMWSRLRQTGHSSIHEGKKNHSYMLFQTVFVRRGLAGKVQNCAGDHGNSQASQIIST